MARLRQRRKPSFLWQALLILLPVGVLAGVGFVSLRRDKILAQHEAMERAQAIADNLLPRLWFALTNISKPEEFEHHAFRMTARGALLFPPPISEPTPPNSDNGELSTRQNQLWLEVERAETGDQDSAKAIQALQSFLATDPSDRYKAITRYNLSVLLAKSGQLKGAEETLQTLLGYLDGHPIVTESGLSLKPLAEFKLLELKTVLTNPPVNPRIIADHLCSEVIFDPSPLSASFINWVYAHIYAPGVAVPAEEWDRVWYGHEESRHLYLSAHRALMTNGTATAADIENRFPRLRWFSEGNQNWLAVRFDDVEFPPSAIEKMASRGTSANWSGTTFDRLQRSHPDFDRPVRQDTQTGHAEMRDINGMPIVTGPAIDFESKFVAPWFLCRNESELSQILPPRDGAEKIPDYFGIGIEIAGKRLRESAPDLRLWRQIGFFERGGVGKPRVYLNEPATNVLASAVQFDSGAEQLRVNVYLTSPSALFKRQADRTFWFGSLVSTAALAAFVGLFSAWRAFNRQQELAEMKSNFVSSVSHELRAPIASVRLMAESLERGKVADPPKQQEYFRFIGQECRRLSSLIENVLDFSRIEQGRKQYEFEPTDLLALLQQTVKVMEPYASEKQIALRLDLKNLQSATFNLELSVDGRAIQQAIVNLLDNAIKHSSNGQTVTVGLEVPENPNHESVVSISVQDNGPGIPAEEHEKIFERFYRLGSELRRETQGVGIGLSIVKHIVEAHHGRVVVESAPGQGSRFTIELPITKNRT